MIHGLSNESIHNRVETTKIIENSAKNTDSAEASKRLRRQVARPSRFSEYEMYSDVGVDEEGDITHLAMMAGSEPLDINDALSQPIWKEAMIEELREKNNMWKLVDLPPRKQCIGVKWVFKRKLNPDGTISKHKARLVARGFLQKRGVDFTEFYAPVARLEIIRLVVAITCAKKWLLFALDVKSAFLRGLLEEEVYVQQPLGFSKKDKKHQLYKLHKALYGLRQALRAWNNRTDAFFLSHGFERCVVEHSLCMKKSVSGDIMILCLYVDDLLVSGSNLKEIDEFKQMMEAKFEMTDLRRLNYFLRMESTHTTAGLLMQTFSHTLN